MIRVLHISDTHFGTEVSTTVDAFWQSVRTLAPTLVICSGDVTQRARRKEFKKASDFLQRFGNVPRVVVPGNHDIPLFNLAARVFRPYAGYQKSLGELQSQYEEPLVKVIALNTTHPARHKHGVVSRAQVEHTSAHLQRSSPQQLRLVVAHHPLYVSAASERRNQLRGSRFAARKWADAGVDLVLGGHIHLPYFAPVPATFADTSRSFWVAQAGTVVSRRTRPGFPNSFNLIRWDGRRCELERWDLNASCNEFERKLSHPMPITRDGRHVAIRHE